MTQTDMSLAIFMAVLVILAVLFCKVSDWLSERGK